MDSQFSYVQLPPGASPVVARPPPPTIVTATPPAQHANHGPPSPATPSTHVTSPTSKFNIPSLLLSSALHLPTPPPTDPRRAGSALQLVSNGFPLSIQITTVNFRRFVGKAGPIFWLQDRVEEILMWKKGWKVTCAWMAGYAFLCIYPRLVLLLPHLALLGILLTTYQLQHPEATLPTAFSETAPPCSLPQSSEGSADWYANLQAIQNLMGAVADAHDATQPLVLHMTWSTRATLPLFLFLLSTLFPLAALLRFIPLRPVFLVGGLLPFLITHPYTLALLPSLQHQLAPSLTTALTKAGDDARLEERHWAAAADKDAQGNPRMLRDFEVWENERWTPTTGWKSANLRTGERKAWTRDGEGRNDIITGAEDVRHITFKLDPGWAFVETEDWHADLLGAWSKVGADEDGWVYTNDAWQDPHDVAVDDWKSNGMTRRRRWTRRVYFMGIAEAKK